MSEKKKVVMKDWEIKKPKGFSAGYTISQIRKIESCFDSCDNLLHQIGLNLGYSSKRSKFINAIENISVIINYVDEIVYEIVGTIDIPLRDSFNSGATETISRIHVEDIETSNTIGVKEAYGKYDSAKGVYVSGERVARKLKFKDFIGGGKVGGKYREKFIELFKEDYENISKSIKENDKNGVLSYDKYIEYLIKDGEFDHKVNQPFKSFVSGLLDLTIIKPIIEAYTGTDLITGEDLTDLERGLKGVGSVIDILTLGQAMTIAKGAEAGISKMLKTVAVEGLSNVAGYTAAEISNAYDMPPLVSMIVSLGAGITASKVGCKYIIKDSSGKVIQEISEEVARNIDNTSNTTSIKENILKNVEESRIARETSGYKSFIEVESGLTKGVGKANIRIMDKVTDSEFLDRMKVVRKNIPKQIRGKYNFGYERKIKEEYTVIPSVLARSKDDIIDDQYIKNYTFNHERYYFLIMKYWGK